MERREIEREEDNMWMAKQVVERYAKKTRSLGRI